MMSNPSLKTIQRIESAEGCAARDILYRLYVTEYWTVRKLCARWGMNNRTILKLLRAYDVPIRQGREAIKASWVNADARRKATSERFREKVKPFHPTPRLGLTKETSEGARRAAEKLKITTSARRPEVKAKMAATKCRQNRENPALHPNSQIAPTPAEAIMMQHLQDMGFEVIHSYYVPHHWVDLYLPALKLGIECFHTGRLPLQWHRHQTITRYDMSLVYVANRYITSGKLRDFDQFIADFKVGSTNPTPGSQNTMVWGRRKVSTTFNTDMSKLSTEVIFMNREYRLNITAPAVN